MLATGEPTTKAALITDWHPAFAAPPPLRRFQARKVTGFVTFLQWIRSIAAVAERKGLPWEPHCVLHLNLTGRTLSEETIMTKVTEAVYSQGVLKPAEDLGLREDQRVRLIVETVDDKAVDRAAALARLKAGIAKMQFFSQGPLPSREELHDRS